MNKIKKIPVYVYMLQIISSILFVFTSLLVKNLVDAISNSHSIPDFMKIVLITALGMTIVQLIVMVKDIYIEKFIINKNKELIKKISESIFKKSYYEYYKNSNSDYISVYTNKLERLEENFFRNKATLIGDVVTFITCIFTVLYISYIFIFVFIFLAFITIFLPVFFNKRLYKYQKLQNKSNETMLNKITSYFNSYTSIRMLGKSNYLKNKTIENTENYFTNSYKFKLCQSIQFNILMYCGIASQVLILMFGGILVQSGSLTIGSLIALTSLSYSFIGPISNISQKRSVMKSSESIFEELNDIIQSNQESSETLTIVSSIKVNDFTCEVDNKKLLDNFSYNFEPGNSYLIIGPSGSGKSTLLKYLSGQLKSNKIWFDSFNSEEITPKIAMITQHPQILTENIFDNVTLGVDKDSEFKDITKRYQIDDFLNYDEISMDNKNFSGGQLQRIELARNIFFNTNILIIDEGLTGVDNETFGNIFNNLKEENKLLIMVSHNKDILENYNFDDVIDLKSFL